MWRGDAVCVGAKWSKEKSLTQRTRRSERTGHREICGEAATGEVVYLGRKLRVVEWVDMGNGFDFGVERLGRTGVLSERLKRRMLEAREREGLATSETPNETQGPSANAASGVAEEERLASGLAGLKPGTYMGQTPRRRVEGERGIYRCGCRCEVVLSGDVWVPDE